jgi:tRNA-dihydrouridine synthase B
MIPLPTLTIGPYRLKNPFILAPMAGVTDRPFRQICKNFGAGLAVSEMVGAQSLLQGSEKTARRANHIGETRPVSVQIAGADPEALARAAQYNADLGAEIIDINMGCPAKKICNTMAGSALLRDEPLVARILSAVTKAVSIPVTLKIRTGWSPEHRNGITIAKIAEDCGIAALSVHGRTRACLFKGEAEYDTIAAIKAAVSLPIIANGNIDSPQKALFVLQHTKADGIMIGRAAQGKPWLFAALNHYFETQTLLADPPALRIKALILEHLHYLYAFYGEQRGILFARKHVSWYTKGLAYGGQFRAAFNPLNTTEDQYSCIHDFFEKHSV